MPSSVHHTQLCEPSKPIYDYLILCPPAAHWSPGRCATAIPPLGPGPSSRPQHLLPWGQHDLWGRWGCRLWWPHTPFRGTQKKKVTFVIQSDVEVIEYSMQLMYPYNTVCHSWGCTCMLTCVHTYCPIVQFLTCISHISVWAGQLSLLELCSLPNCWCAWKSDCFVLPSDVKVSHVIIRSSIG